MFNNIKRETVSFADCSRCGGSGYVGDHNLGKKCPDCGGTGKVV